MLPTVNRLKKRVDFEKVKEVGRKFQSESFGLALVDRKDTKPTRFGFVVSTKISKKAVARNKVKRNLKNAVQRLLSEVGGGYDVIFLAKREILAKDLLELETEVKNIFKKIKLL